MMFVEQFELITKFVDGTVSLDVYPTYGEAYDAAILKAAKELPENETVICFTINKSYINVAFKRDVGEEK